MLHTITKHRHANAMLSLLMSPISASAHRDPYTSKENALRSCTPVLQSLIVPLILSSSTKHAFLRQIAPNPCYSTPTPMYASAQQTCSRWTIHADPAVLTRPTSIKYANASWDTLESQEVASNVVPMGFSMAPLAFALDTTKVTDSNAIRRIWIVMSLLNQEHPLEPKEEGQ